MLWSKSTSNFTFTCNCTIYFVTFYHCHKVLTLYITEDLFFSSECDEYCALFVFLMDAFQHSEVLCYRQVVTCSAPSFGNQIWQLLLFAKSKYMHRKKVHIEIVLFYIGTVDNEYVLLLHHFISESVSVISIPQRFGFWGKSILNTFICVSFFYPDLVCVKYCWHLKSFWKWIPLYLPWVEF